MAIEVTKYTPALREDWNSFVKEAVNSTFLFMRDYMDYHCDRFCDCSLMFYRGKSLIALLPANIKEDEGVLQSHGGLTYGGLIMHPDTKATDTLEIFKALVDYMRNSINVTKLLYKPLPYIYNSRPADEPLYALFRMGATIAARAISTTIDNSNREAFGSQRLRGMKKAQKAGITCSRSTQYRIYWNILTDTLRTAHNCSPTHTIEEIELLQSRFPDNIKLYTANIGEETVAGIVVYESESVAHLQYIAASPTGKAHGALDALVNYLVNEVYTQKRFIDFGISTEQGGTILNCGLIEQKEGFGGRAVVYDTYELCI